MTRVPELAIASLSSEQKRVRDDIAGPRGGQASGPFGVWLRVPEIADAANRLGNSLRLNGRIERHLFELMVLVVARQWSAHYAFHVHEEHAREAGLDASVIDAIRGRRRPDFARADERLIYDTVSELIETKALSEARYQEAVAALGLDRVIELVAAVGFYTMVAITLNAFEVPARGDKRLP
ncbi:MAG TPA: hypothetical protein VMU87_12620 [Stellaceae bacterium]|nr:hypothetical protein [Stellaceae bacterium]